MGAHENLHTHRRVGKRLDDLLLALREVQVLVERVVRRHLPQQHVQVVAPDAVLLVARDDDDVPCAHAPPRDLLQLLVVLVRDDRSVTQPREQHVVRQVTRVHCLLLMPRRSAHLDQEKPIHVAHGPLVQHALAAQLRVEPLQLVVLRDDRVHDLRQRIVVVLLVQPHVPVR